MLAEIPANFVGRTCFPVACVAWAEVLALPLGELAWRVSSTCLPGGWLDLGGSDVTSAGGLRAACVFHVLCPGADLTWADVTSLPPAMGLACACCTRAFPDLFYFKGSVCTSI